MRKDLFDELVESIQEAGKIRKGLLKPSRGFGDDSMDVLESYALQPPPGSLSRNSRQRLDATHIRRRR